MCIRDSRQRSEKKILGDDHEETLACKIFEVRVDAAATKVYSDNISTLITLISTTRAVGAFVVADATKVLAELLADSGDIQQALSIGVRALQCYQKLMLYKDSLDIASCFELLGRLFSLEGKIDEATSSYAKCAEIKTRMYGIDHKQTLRAKSTLTDVKNSPKSSQHSRSKSTFSEYQH
eukprot:TRINITY_DN14560_c0_g1_i1.p1 TRINITY_DN14560_c0_g1~~TRINITY_DN14560_c0_g1_i1.p1  ORF type:complete len:198 (-),score=41.94 TRINITY_DN14560_c0_g1_i1:242-778(-)